jgi:hypothetical protein
VSGCERAKPRKKSAVRYKEVEEDRVVFIAESLPLLFSTPQRQTDLRDPTQCELVDRPLQFQKCRHLFIRAHNKTLSVAMRVNNPDRSPFSA